MCGPLLTSGCGSSWLLLLLLLLLCWVLLLLLLLHSTALCRYCCLRGSGWHLGVRSCCRLLLLLCRLCLLLYWLRLLHCWLRLLLCCLCLLLHLLRLLLHGMTCRDSCSWRRLCSCCYTLLAARPDAMHGFLIGVVFSRACAYVRV
jgi:hypothetical protein